MRSPVLGDLKWGSHVIHRKARAPTASWVDSNVFWYSPTGSAACAFVLRARRLSEDPEDVYEEDDDVSVEE